MMAALILTECLFMGLDEGRNCGEWDWVIRPSALHAFHEIMTPETF